MSYLAMEGLGCLNIHEAQAANIHSALHLSVEQPLCVFKEVHASVCVGVCVCRYVIQGCSNLSHPETHLHPPPHKITAQVFDY